LGESDGVAEIQDQSDGEKIADGLYRVMTSYLCAGFVVEGGKVTRCAPILRKRLAYWQTVAVFVRGPKV
jgi:hypothetical protein